MTRTQRIVAAGKKAEAHRPTDRHGLQGLRQARQASKLKAAISKPASSVVESGPTGPVAAASGPTLR